MDLSQTPSSAPLQRPAPWLIAANAMLVLSSDDLATLLAQKADENPALELEECPVCPRCGHALQGASCLDCLSLASSSQLGETDGWLAESSWQAGGSEEDAFDPMNLLSAPVAFRAQLCLALRMQLPNEEAELIEYLVESLDDDGYLQVSLEEIAALFRVPLERVEQVLTELQAQEPAGIGARSVQECLLLQLPARATEGMCPPYAREVIEQYLPWLGQRKYREIAHALGCPLHQVKAVQAFLLQHLQPYPLRSALGSPQSPLGPLLPAVCIHPQSEGRGYEVEVLEAHRFRLQVSPAYLTAARDPGACSATEHEQLQHSLVQAKFVLANLQRRWQTLARITRYLAERQQAFVEQGPLELVSLTREEVAVVLELHPSTVSRAMADKAVLLPSGQVVPFSTFFTPNLRVKAVLHELLRQAELPLSDQRLSELLHARGFTIARRTVAKYREELGILPSCVRARSS